MEKQYFNRAEFGEAVFKAIKTDLISRGFALWKPKFDPNYPISLRAINNIRTGQFRVETLNTLPNIKVEECFCLHNIDAL